MKRQLFIIIILLIVSCTKKDSDLSDQSAADSIAGDPTGEGIASGSETEYAAALNNLPDSASSLIRGLEMFRDQFDKSDPANNDKALKTFLEFQDDLANKLNDTFYRNPDYEKINAQIWEDSLQHDITVKAFSKKMKSSGFRFDSSEGMVYLAPETSVIRGYFFEHLSPSTKEFFNQFELEMNQPFSEDAGFAIPVKAIADRLGFWDTFSASYPDHLFSYIVTGNKDHYLYALLIGENNTPAFDYDSGKLDDEFLEAYKHFLQIYTRTKSASVIEQYLDLLQKSGYTKSREVETFSKKYNPYE